MSSSAVSTDQLLRRYARWPRLAWPLAILVAGLAATLLLLWYRHPSLGRVEHWHGLSSWWMSGVGATLLAAAGIWLFRRNSLVRGAQQLDERLQAKNRLETAAAYQHDSGVLASAQREEAAEFLRRQAPAHVRRFPLAALFALVAVLAGLHLATLLSWSRPWLAQPVVAVKPAAALTSSPIPLAQIKWKSPRAESKAAPIEEVPLQALAESTGGLRDLVLEMAVNGQPKLSLPIKVDEIKEKGPHPIQTSIYLDQLEVEPFDIVSYYLRAQRIDERKLPQTTSPVQFVQIKKFRDDAREVKGGGEGNAGFALITALKAAQLRMVKENFVLAHTELGQDNDDWKRENSRVGSEQGALQKKTGEVIEILVQKSAPAEIINLLSQAQPFMGEAAQKIVNLSNEPALTPQGKALGLITEVEKFMVKLLAKGGTMYGDKKNPEDPFRDKKQLEMKQRFKTAAGELEQLATAQAKLADDLTKPDGAPLAPEEPKESSSQTPDPDKISGSPTERQTQISQRLGAALNGRTFNAEVTGHLEKGHEAARGSLQQLDAGDQDAAREPAALAAHELQRAIEAMDRAGKEEAKEQFAQVQRELNEAAEKASEAAKQNGEREAKERAEAAAKQAEEAARKLAEAARAQQETGSGDAAKRLEAMTKAIQAQETRRALEGLRAHPRDPAAAKTASEQLERLADRAAQGRQADPLTKDEIARLAEKLEAIRANMQRLAANEAGPKMLAALNSPMPDKGTAEAGSQPGSPGPEGTPKSEDPAAGGQPANGQPGKEGNKESASSPQGGQGQQGKHGQEQGKGEAQGKGTGEKGQGKGEGQGQGTGEKGQGQGKGDAQTQGESGQDQGQGRQPGRGEGQGQSQGQGQASGRGRGGQGSGEGEGQGGKSGNGQSGGTSSDGNDSKEQRDRKESDLGDTYGTKTAETSYGPVQPGMLSTQKPKYTDHAPREAQTRDPQQTRERFARELVEEARESMQLAATVLPGSRELLEMRESLREAPVEMHYADRAAFFAKVDSPLLGLIHALLAREGQTVRREHRLTEQNADEAPPAYRPAVADYFEQLSRDYSNSPSDEDSTKQ